MLYGLLCCAADPLDAVPIAGTAHQHGTVHLRDQFLQQFLDLLWSFCQCHAPIVAVCTAHPLTVAAQDAVQKCPEVIALKFVAIPLLQPQPVHGKVAERALAKCLQPCGTPAEPMVARKEPCCHGSRDGHFARREKKSMEHTPQERLHHSILQHPVVDIPPHDGHFPVLFLFTQRSSQMRECRIRCREEQRIISPSQGKRDGEKGTADSAQPCDQRRRSKGRTIHRRKRIRHPEVVACLRKSTVELIPFQKALLCTPPKDGMPGICSRRLKRLTDEEEFRIGKYAARRSRARHDAGIRPNDKNSTRSRDAVLIKGCNGDMIQPRRNQGNGHGVKPIAQELLIVPAR